MKSHSGGGSVISVNDALARLNALTKHFGNFEIINMLKSKIEFQQILTCSVCPVDEMSPRPSAGHTQTVSLKLMLLRIH